jgi:hypothetical protein
LQEALPGSTSVSGPTALYAQYDDGPDQRVTARFAINDSRHRDVVLKANCFDLLSGSLAAHKLAFRGAPDLVPELLAARDLEVGSLLVFCVFTGFIVGDLGQVDPLRKTARTLAHIQTRCTEASADADGLALIPLSQMEQKFVACFEEIRVRSSAWSDPEGKLTKALRFPAREVLGRLESLHHRIANWVSAVEATGLRATIEHGDCHAGNAVYREDGSILIFDWENACLSHPFLSAEKLLTSAWALDVGSSGGPWGYVRDTPTQDSLAHDYMEVFETPRHGIQEAFDAAMCLAVVKEMHHEMEWAGRCSWKDLNPEWTAQLINRLVQHAERVP